MTLAQSRPTLSLPDHTQLPESDGTFVKNFQEHPQSLLLTSSILPTLNALHPDGQYAIGQDCGIYWRLTNPLHQGAEAPDWFYVPNVPPLLNGKMRRSYVLWQEVVAPLIAIEFVSGDGSEERDSTPPSQAKEGSKVGKFWVYEQAIRIPFYAIYEVEKGKVEVYELRRGHYEKCEKNERGHYEITGLGVELGIWKGEYMNQVLPWLRWWDDEGNLLLTGEERAEQEKQRAEHEKLRAEQERQEKLRAQERAEQERQEKLRAEERAEQERQEKLRAEERAEHLAAKLRELGFSPEDL
jgi:Uma2 family endonuclease